MGESKADYGFNKVAVYGLLEKNNMYLMLKRANTGYMEGMYSLPAGRIEPDETLRQAVIREIKEEIGLNVEAGALQAVHFAYRVPDNYVDVFFLVDSWQGQPANMEPDKCSDVSWHPKEGLPTNTIPFIRQVLGQIAAGRHFSEYEQEPS
jgi:mutator protein MutT